MIRGNGEATSGPLRSQTRLKIYGTNLASRTFQLPLIAGILKESATYGNNFTLKVTSDARKQNEQEKSSLSRCG